MINKSVHTPTLWLAVAAMTGSRGSACEKNNSFPIARTTIEEQLGVIRVLTAPDFDQIPRCFSTVEFRNGKAMMSSHALLRPLVMQKGVPRIRTTTPDAPIAYLNISLHYPDASYTNF